MNKYNDGICYLYEDKNITTDFNAKKNVRTLKDMKKIGYLAFKETSKRAEDIDFAEGINRSLTLKIKTPLYDKVKNNLKVVINGMMYNIIKLDFDRMNRELYFYLEEEREVKNA